MENKNIPMLELLLRPAFYVRGGAIEKVNQAAAGFLLQERMEILPLIATGKEEYKAFTEGCLYLSMELAGQTVEATVLSVEDYHLFVLEQSNTHSELQALALAAQELRIPLTAMAMSANRLFDNQNADLQQVANFNRRLYQMMRTVSNMSDTIHYCNNRPSMEVVEICSFLEEIVEKSAVLMEHLGITLRYKLPEKAIYTMADPEKLERAVYNLLSNAAKHTATNGTITVELQHRNRLYLSVTDSGNGLDIGIKTNVYSRYLRPLSLSNGAEGLGLGMVLVRTIALMHGGTVLIDHPDSGGTRVTMTLSICQQRPSIVRSSVLHIDYAGERDHALQELADVLPAELYAPNNLK